jgi:hypothetical protein
MELYSSAVLENVKVLALLWLRSGLLGTEALRMANSIGDTFETGLSTWLNGCHEEGEWVNQPLRHIGGVRTEEIRTEEGKDESGRLYNWLAWLARLLREDPTLETDAQGVLGEVRAITSSCQRTEWREKWRLDMGRLKEGGADFGAAATPNMSMRKRSQLGQGLCNDILRWLPLLTHVSYAAEGRTEVLSTWLSIGSLFRCLLSIPTVSTLPIIPMSF